MELNRAVWQQAAGDTDREYAELCLRWDVILNGPGGDAPWPACKEALRQSGVTKVKLADLRRFAEDLKEGDLVVLHSGQTKLIGVGRAVGPYEWSEEFGDVDGWDLKHARRVRWLWRAPSNQSGGLAPVEMPAGSFKFGATTQKLTSPEVLRWLRNLVVDEPPLTPLPELPKSGDELGLDDISDHLFDRGLASQSIAAILSEIGEFIRIARWYDRSETVVSEHETVSYLVAPLLRALGWTPQRMGVEWNRVDVALFEKLPRSDETLSLVVEAKRLRHSCLSAKLQAQGGAKGRPRCLRLIVTDGLRYGVYTRSSVVPDKFSLHAYLNLTRLRSSYPVHECSGAVDALWAMSPEWRPETEATRSRISPASSSASAPRSCWRSAAATHTLSAAFIESPRIAT